MTSQLVRTVAALLLLGTATHAGAAGLDLGKRHWPGSAPGPGPQYGYGAATGRGPVHGYGPARGYGPAYEDHPRYGYAPRYGYERYFGATPAPALPYRSPRLPPAPLLDRDADGLVSEDEAAAGREHAFDRRDLDGNGRLSEGELPGVDRPAGMRFEDLDTDRDGIVTRAEFMRAGHSHFARSDRDGDGRVTVWEYRSSPRP